MRLLVLDLARTFGWAVGSPSGVEAFGHHELTRTASWSLGDYGMEARMVFRRMLAEVQPDRAAYEAPILRSGKIATRGNGKQFVKTIDTPEKLRKIYGLPWEFEIECYRAGVPVNECSIGSVRKHFLMGKVPTKSDDCKAAVSTMARRRGWAVLSHDEADALAALDYELTMKEPKAMMGQQIRLGGSPTLSSRGAGVFVGSRQFFPPASSKAGAADPGGPGAGPSNASSTATAGPSGMTGAGPQSPRITTPTTSSAKQQPASWR